MTRIIPPWLYEERPSGKVAIIGGKEYPVDIRKPPAYLFLTYLQSLLPTDWLCAQEYLPIAERNTLFAWLSAFERFLAKWEERGLRSEYADLVSPESVAMTVLAYDLYSLDQARALQEKLVARLLDRRSFQSAAHEIAVAATMMRSGFLLDFEDEADSSRKHPEFIATHRRTGIRVAVEAKSIHRSGVLGSEVGKPPPTIQTATAHKMTAQICGQVEKALPKANGLPLYVFVDLNLPPAVADRIVPTAFSEFQTILPQIDSGFGDRGRFVGKVMNLLAVSNRAVHLGELSHNKGHTLQHVRGSAPGDLHVSGGITTHPGSEGRNEEIWHGGRVTALCGAPFT